MKIRGFFLFFFFLTAVSTVARTATAGEDYTAALSGTADFDANDDTEAMVTLTIMNDMNVESTEQLELTLTVAAAVGVAGEVDKTVVNILDDDAPRTLKFIIHYYSSQLISSDMIMMIAPKYESILGIEFRTR